MIAVLDKLLDLSSVSWSYQRQVADMPCTWRQTPDCTGHRRAYSLKGCDTNDYPACKQSAYTYFQAKIYPKKDDTLNTYKSFAAA